MAFVYYTLCCAWIVPGVCIFEKPKLLGRDFVELRAQLMKMIKNKGKGGGKGKGKRKRQLLAEQEDNEAGSTTDETTVSE